MEPSPPTAHSNEAHDHQETNLISDQENMKKSSSLKAADHVNEATKCSPPSTTTIAEELCKDEETTVHVGAAVGDVSSTTAVCRNEVADDRECGRERLKRHRVEVAGRVWIPDIWGQEDFLTEWIDCAAQFDASLMHKGILSARVALVQEGRSASSGGLSIENRC